MLPIEAFPGSEAGKIALEIYAEALESVRADRLIRQNLRLDGDILWIQSSSYDLGACERIILAGAGKASALMAAEAWELLKTFSPTGLVVTKGGHGVEIPGVEVLEAGHPVPDERTVLAGSRMIRLARTCGPSDLVLFFLSGGASSLLEYPVDGISLDELRSTNEILLSSGAEIEEVNTVRTALSRIKGGALSAEFGEATVAVIVLSDVLGNPLASIGSGPFYRPKTEKPVSLSILDKLSPGVRAEFLASRLTKKLVPARDHFVIGSVSVAMQSAIQAAQARGLVTFGIQDPLTGEAKDAARNVMQFQKRFQEETKLKSFCLVFGGETTVTLGESPGLGGRCQEMAVAAVPLVAKIDDFAFLAAGTDGTDGPTDAAGAIVESATLAGAKTKGLDFRDALVHHASHEFLSQTSCLIKTGPTGTNVNDLCILVKHSASPDSRDEN